MSIRSKILLGCLSLTLVTILAGLLARSAEVKLGTSALRIYDEAFMSMSYLRSAQNTVLTVSREISRDVSGGLADSAMLADKLHDAVEDLDITRSRAMSPRGAAIANRLRTNVATLEADIRDTGMLASGDRVAVLEREFDEAVEVFAGDGYVVRRSVVTLVRQTTIGTWIGMMLSVAIALLITYFLSRAIVPSVRHAVRIATAIAAGKLDNRIDVRGASETGVLLRALAAMQASIAEKMARIQALLTEQASSHASEVAIQNARFEAALDNMTQGLCMFDATGHLLVYNQRFSLMFGVPTIGALAQDVLPGTLLLDPVSPDEDGVGSVGRVLRSSARPLADGRTIAVSEQPLAGGGWVGTYEDVTERHLAESRLSHMARHDSLTGLPNRVLYREQMDHALAEVRRGGGLAVLCLDLDQFKQVNDTLGHGVGDTLLQAVAQRLRDTTRETDTVVRLGGDEFAIIQCSATQPHDSKALAERVVKVLAAPFEIGDHRISIGASVGIAVTSEGIATAEGLLKSADMALYRAKADGRGTYRFFEPEMDARMQARHRLEQDLRRAVVSQEFEVFYQPLVAAGSRSIEGFEALVRWCHPLRGMVSPAEFIPVAEDIGLISVIGAWVLNQACHDAMRWPEHLKLAVNLSPLQFRNRSLAGEVAAALDVSGLPAHRLELEITESLMLQDSGQTLDILHELRALGSAISMDDFGTGYSSLSYLRRFPFDKIKIDQTFVRNLGMDGESIAIVRAVAGLGRSLGMTVNAEGVETEEQLSLLRAEGCTQVQGYLFSPPRPVSALPMLMERLTRDSLQRKVIPLPAA